jgi:hypothetical protein
LGDAAYIYGLLLYTIRMRRAVLPS